MKMQATIVHKQVVTFEGGPYPETFWKDVIEAMENGEGVGSWMPGDLAFRGKGNDEWDVTDVTVEKVTSK
jgi:hypothetical protein